jgi:hypothetical protein
MSRRSVPHLARSARAIGALALGSGVLALGLPAGASLRPAAALNCSLVSASTLSKLIGVTVKAPTSVVEGQTTTCTYADSVGGVILQYETGYSESLFQGNVKLFHQHGESTTKLAGYGSDAVAISIGKLSAGLSLIKGSHGFLVSAVEPLAKLEAVAHQVLPSL